MSNPTVDSAGRKLHFNLTGYKWYSLRCTGKGLLQLKCLYVCMYYIKLKQYELANEHLITAKKRYKEITLFSFNEAREKALMVEELLISIDANTNKAEIALTASQEQIR
ncbi:unnamed protein product [Didymodactylos carnosus]|uniref:Uncharacterized protein n=1 Tax=Didymodactylos carnosus TaxID=1234261 RepID=A0A8S2D923_9BILA|nr:unnamed protein product [Didymodactylos carnosus]CAF3627562.1 unnamed protein product [Didymodactylos carnosus]